MKIPNREVKHIYKESVREWFHARLAKQDFHDLYESMEKGDAAGMQKVIKSQLWDSISFMDSATNNQVFLESGYPFLVSKYCKLIDERVTGGKGYLDRKAAWTRQGFLEADKMLLSENNTLFESLFGKLRDYPELDEILRAILLSGWKQTYNPDMGACQLGTMFGFIKNKEGDSFGCPPSHRSISIIIAI